MRYEDSLRNDFDELVDKGKVFVAVDKQAENPAALFKYIFSTGTKGATLIFLDMASNDDGTDIEVCETPTYSAIGTEVPSSNYNTALDATHTSESVLYHTPTTSADGDTLFLDQLTTETKDMCRNGHYLLKPSTKYLIKITNKVNSKTQWTNICWAEGN